MIVDTEQSNSANKDLNSQCEFSISFLNVNTLYQRPKAYLVKGFSEESAHLQVLEVRTVPL
jgi:hypothetical protein